MAAHTGDIATKELVSGCAAGVANVVSGFPFDTVKVRLQSSRGTYRSMLHCFSEIWKKEGMRGFYRGLTPPLIGGALETGVNYLVYSRLLAHLQGAKPQPELRDVPVAAAAAGVALSVILGPTELIKCRLQMAGLKYTHPMQCLRDTIAKEGYRGLTRGLGATMAREIPGNAVFFSVYEALRRTLPGRPRRDQEHISLLEVVEDATSAVVCGGIAGTTMWAAVLPLDVAKTRIQTAQPGSAWDVGILRHLHMLTKEGGVRALWAGFSPTVVRAFPANACQWVTWELAIRSLSSPITSNTAITSP